MNNGSAGGAKPKEGDNAVVINRASGYRQAMTAMDNKTRSGHRATGKNYQWTGAGSGTGGNMRGWGKH